ncbi:MAG: nucleotidyl transferase AbiEii/AbiGii toxin family protein [Planctomycetota bacterium]
MTKDPVKNLAASIHQRLLNKAKQEGRLFNEVLRHYALERFLYRLSKSPYADKLALKGGLMFRVWKVPLSRPTKDIDMLGRTDNSIDNILSMVRDVCTQEVEPDGLQFDPTTLEAERITEDADYNGVRVKWEGNLGNAQIDMRLDIGFSDVVTPQASLVDYPTLLDLPAPRLYGYSMESVIAEKFEAMVKLGELNSRMKDFFDIWLLSRTCEFDGLVLAQAIRTTFNTRGTEIPADPVALTDSFAADQSKGTQWRSFLRTSNLGYVEHDFAKVVTSIAGFLKPLAVALASDQDFAGTWKPRWGL